MGGEKNDVVEVINFSVEYLPVSMPIILPFAREKKDESHGAKGTNRYKSRCSRMSTRISAHRRSTARWQYVVEANPVEVVGEKAGHSTSYLSC